MAEKNTNVVIIDGNPYDVEIFLIKECGEFGILPIAYSSLKYLEITNDLANIGYTGKIIFTNFNDILEKLYIFTAVNSAPILYFKLKSLGFGDEESTYDNIFFFAALTEGQDFKENAIDGNSAYNFEELYTFKLKTTKALNKSLTGTIPKEGSVSSLLEYLLTFNQKNLSNNTRGLVPLNAIGVGQNNGNLIDLAAIQDTHILSEVEIVGEPVTDIINSTIGTSATNTTTIYEAIMNLYPYLSFKPILSNDTDWYGPGMIKIENDRDKKNNGKRKIIMFPLLNTILDFFTSISKPEFAAAAENSSTDNYYNNRFLTEKFVVAQGDSAGYLSDNSIDKYELKRVNYNDVLKNKKWVTTKCTAEFGDCFINTTRLYRKTRQFFEKNCVYPYPCNLPPIPLDQEAIKEYKINKVDPNLALAYGTNKVLKSFVLDNLAVVFRVKGQPYRKPNRFISINPTVNDKTLGDESKNKEEVSGYWYVTSIKHLFENGHYFNEFTCVKMYDLNSTKSNETFGNDEISTDNNQNEDESSINGGDELA